MPNALTAQGLTTASQQELLTNKTQSLQKIYGDIDLNSNTPDGQAVNIEIQSILDLQNLLVSIYNSFDPDNAYGVQLEQRCAINGVQKQAGTYSVTPETIVIVKPNTYLYGLDQADQPVYTISDNTGNQWLLQTTQSNLSPGTIVCDFRAATPGANITIPNSINIPVTIVLGVLSVNNPTAQSIVGLNEESDANLKIRRAISVAISSQGYEKGLRAALLNIPGISSAFVYENKTNTTDINGVPEHTIWVIVDGFPIVLVLSQWVSTLTYSYGDIVSSAGINYISWQDNNLNHAVSDPAYWGIYNPVAQTIYIKRNAGCGMIGETSYTVTQDDGTQFIVNYDTVVEENLFIAFTATSINGINPPNIAGIIERLVDDYVPQVNQRVNINEMACIVQEADPNCLVTNAGFSAGHIQVVTLSGVAASGVFKFSYNGNNTSNINWNDNAATIQTELRLLLGLEACVVTGSIASQTLTITLNVESVLSLIYVLDNTLETSGPVAITFSFNEDYQNFLLPSSKKNKFVVSADKIIILPMILSPITIIVAKLATQQFTSLGGYGIKTYSMQANPSGGSIDSSGLYTAGNIAATDIAKVIDSFGNTATATITVP